MVHLTPSQANFTVVLQYNKDGYNNVLVVTKQISNSLATDGVTNMFVTEFRL